MEEGPGERKAGRGPPPDPKGSLGLGDHRKSSSTRKRKGEAEVLGRDTHPQTAPGVGRGEGRRQGKRRPPGVS